MWWTRLCSACWCMLMYSATKNLLLRREKISFCYTHRAKGDTGHSHLLQYFVHQHQTEITISFPVKLGQSAHVRSSSTHQLMHEKVVLGPCDTRANEVVLGCFSASYLEVELSFYFVRRNTWGERSNLGSACSFWQKLTFILRPNGFSSCMFTGRDKKNKASYECLDQFATMAMAHSNVRWPQCLLIKPH